MSIRAVHGANAGVMRDFALSPPCLRDTDVHSSIHSAAGVQRLFPIIGAAMHPRLSITVRDTPVPDARARLSRIREVLDVCKGNISKALEKYSYWANKKRTPAPSFEVGDKVWVRSSVAAPAIARLPMTKDGRRMTEDEPARRSFVFRPSSFHSALRTPHSAL